MGGATLSFPQFSKPYPMPRKPKRGYFVQGQFVAEGSELDEQIQRELKGDTPSRSELKRESTELQKLGKELVQLGAAARRRLSLSEKLEDALAAAQKITDFEGLRRQMQYLGKLMRGLDEVSLEQIRSALQEQHQGSAEQTEALHLAERWRDKLIGDDAKLQNWLDAHPGTDVQQLRALIRQARKDAAAKGKAHPGNAARQSRAYREIYQLISTQLAAGARTQ